MISLYTEQEYNSAKADDKLKCECEICRKEFFKSKRDVNKVLRGIVPGKYCSKECMSVGRANGTDKHCANCAKPIYVKKAELSQNNFCSSSCAATYNNTHKTSGTRRSMLEVYIEQRLLETYSHLEMLFNSKIVIESELDIYIPSLKVAFEINGIFHYKPIYGEVKFNKIQKNDASKISKCEELGIRLIVINTSTQKTFTQETSNAFLRYIISIIDSMNTTSSN